MRSKASSRFWKAFERLPADVQDSAREVYALFREDPYYPSLRFKRVHAGRPIYSVRISRDYRALGVRVAESGRDEVMLWFWIGSHADYDRLLGRL